jgi:hypothetical protein
MSEFIVKEINKDYAKYLVFSVTADSPLLHLQEIKKHIHLPNVNVIFDQLLQTGNVDNRFLTLSFENNDFNFSTAKHIKNDKVDIETKTEIANFLRQNSLILKYSILLSTQKELIEKGGIL